jgi:hypothetical protein
MVRWLFPPSAPKENTMKYRALRVAYILAALASFVIASGAGHKFGE